MKTAFISDIHANLEALDAVLADVAAEGVDRIYCLGDVVGYGPDPNACIQRIREACAGTVLGNHDQAALGELDTQYFNEYARFATEWTKEALAPENEAWLRGLPLSLEVDEMKLVHASPVDPELWTYVLTLEEAFRQFQGLRERLCFIGHSHLPIVIEEGPGGELQAMRYPGDEPLEIFPERSYLVNVGSVGQPRDRDPRAAYVWYDDELETLRLRRVEYAVEAVQDKILGAGLPGFLAQRLQHGM